MHTFSRKWRRRAAAVVVGLALAMASTPGVAAAAPSDFSVLQINICNSGKNKDCYAGGDATEKAGQLVLARQPSVVTVNEMCYSDLERISEISLYRGFDTFTQSGDQTCENGFHYGNAVLFPPGTEVTEVQRFTYAEQNHDKEDRTLTCARGGDVTACVTHLTVDNDDPPPGMSNRAVRMAQRQEMATIIGGIASRGPTVLGGDWNTRFRGNPDAQDYVPDSMFRKGDGNVQHVLATGAHFRFDRVRVMELGWTDHPGLQVYYTRRAR